jgi:hypothetical protein
VQTWNPSYSGSEDQEDHGWRPAWTKSYCASIRVNGKVRPAETAPGMGREHKGGGGGSQFSYDDSAMTYCKNFVNVVMYPQQNNKMLARSHLNQ